MRLLYDPIEISISSLSRWKEECFPSLMSINLYLLHVLTCRDNPLHSQLLDLSIMVVESEVDHSLIGA